MTADAETVAFYDREAASYAGWRAGAPLPKVFLRFAEALPPGAAVLDLGCGGGWAARAFRDRGHPVTALDASAGLLACLAGEPGIDTVRGDFRDLPPGERFDALWSAFALQHAPRAEMPAILAHVTGTLRPGALACIGIHEGAEELRDRLGRFYCHYTEPELRGLLSSAGLAVEAVDLAQDRGYDGRPITTLTLRARKEAR